MSDAVFPSYPVTEEEPLSSIVARLKNNWRNHSETIGEALMRLIACLDSGSDLNLSGIDRDLIVYAMAHTRSVAQAPKLPDIEAICHDYAQRWFGQDWTLMKDEKAELRIEANRWLKCWRAVSVSSTQKNSEAT